MLSASPREACLSRCSQGPSLIEWLPDIELDGHLPMKSIPRPRAYSHIVFDPSTSLIVAASSMQSKFASYDEDGNSLWDPDGECTSACFRVVAYLPSSERVFSILRDINP